MPDRDTMQRVKKDRREGKSPSTQAGAFIREEVHHLREGKHGARSTKQAIAIGLSKARRSGVKLGVPEQRDEKKSEHRGGRVSPRRSKAAEDALKKEPRSAGSHRALSAQGRRAAGKRSAASRSAAAKKAAATRRKNR